MGQITLADGSFICKDCEKKVSPYFEPAKCTVRHYHGNLKQNEVGQRLYNTYFCNNKKAVKLCENHVIFDPGTALLCIYGERGGIFGSKKFYNVFRMADLGKYEQAIRFTKESDGSNRQISCVHLNFAGVEEGLDNYLIEADESDLKKLTKEFDQLLGKQEKGAFGFSNQAKSTGMEEMIQRADSAIREALK